jgi:probable H4MPT-linked C1 transfer pathway protein
MPSVVGFDIGGANLKVAHVDGVARSVPFALWRTPGDLAMHLRALRDAMPLHDTVAVTMTGELCDCFETKREGVRAILKSVAEVVDVASIRVWTTRGLFVSFEEAMADPLAAAAANWLSLAHLVSRRFPGRSLLIDTGSTTTDILYLGPDGPEPRGLTDFDRMASGELVYTGIRRTPVCAVLGQDVAAELFATMLDAHLLLGLVPQNASDTDTADGRPATKVHAHSRLARMRCADAESFSFDDAMTLARAAAEQQRAVIWRAAERVLAGRPPVERVVVAGSGEALAHWCHDTHIALGQLPAVSLREHLGDAISEAACAYAVAILASA